jgi:hypothetical protein
MGATSRDFNCVGVQMPEKVFEYTEKESEILGKVLRPLIEVEIKGETLEWIKIENALADTGADISILPRDIGDLLIEDVTKGKPYEVKGIVPYAKLIVYILDFDENYTDLYLSFHMKGSGIGNATISVLGAVV